MNPQRADIVGHRITGIWESQSGEGLYSEHYVSMSNDLFVKFSEGELLRIMPPYPPVVSAIPLRALGARKEDDNVTAPACIGQVVTEVVYSTVTTNLGEVRRDRTYLLLEGGRYLTSGLGFCYTELESDSFERWYVSNKFSLMFRFHWGAQPFNPFGADAIKGTWGGATLIVPAPGEIGAEQGEPPNGEQACDQ